MRGTAHRQPATLEYRRGLPIPVHHPIVPDSSMLVHAPTDTGSRLTVRALAPALLALALSACGTGTPQADALPAYGAATSDTGTGPGSDSVTIDMATDADAATNTGSNMSAGASTGTSTGMEPEPGTIGDSSAEGDIGSDPIGCDATSATLQQRALELIDAVRAEARVCGSAGRFAATGPLGWDSRLETAARTHSTDMATNGTFSHTGTDGSSAADRIERTGYVWGEVAENIAAGQQSLEAAIAGWVDSPGHCRNLMAPGVRDVAVACVTTDDPYRFYWTNVFARPLETRHRP